VKDTDRRWVAEFLRTQPQWAQELSEMVAAYDRMSAGHYKLLQRCAMADLSSQMPNLSVAEVCRALELTPEEIREALSSREDELAALRAERDSAKVQYAYLRKEWEPMREGHRRQLQRLTADNDRLRARTHEIQAQEMAKRAAMDSELAKLRARRVQSKPRRFGAWVDEHPVALWGILSALLMTAAVAVTVWMFPA
jgi:DNA-binding transcriptional MerR regulator